MRAPGTAPVPDPQVVPLPDLVIMARERRGPHRPTLAWSAGEALCLPAGLGPTGLRRAVRVFLGGLTDDEASRAYARVVATGTRCPAGEAPHEDDLRRWLSAHHPAEPHVHTAGSSAPPARGTIPVPDERAGPGRPRPGIPVGRLSAVQTADTVPMLDGTWHLGLATWAAPDLRLAGPHAGRTAGALADTPERARLLAAAEATERFAAGDVRPRDLVLAPAEELDEPWLDPRRIVAYTPRQYARHADLVEFDPRVPRSWVLGRTPSGSPVRVLADLVHCPFRPVGAGPVHCRATSSGVATGTTFEDAARRAHAELVERDRIMRFWYGRRVPARIDPATVPARGRYLVGVLERYGLEVDLVDLSTPSTAVVAALAHGPERLVCGCGAGEPSRAAMQALREATICAAQPPAGGTDPHRVDGPTDHRALFEDPRGVERASFLWSSRRPAVRLDGLPSPREHGAQRLPAGAVLVDLTSELTAPLHVVRCLLPGTVPMSFGHDLEPLGLPGFVAHPRGRGQDGPLPPHPFA